MSYMIQKGEDSDSLNKIVSEFIEQLKSEKNRFDLTSKNQSKSDIPVIMQYFETIEQTEAEKIYASRKSREEKQKNSIQIRVDQLKLENGQLSPVLYLQNLIFQLKGNRKLRRKINAVRGKKPDYDDPFSDVLMLAEALGCDTNQTQDSILDSVMECLKSEQAETALNTSGYTVSVKTNHLVFYTNIEKFTSHVLNVSISYKVSDYFRYLDHRQPDSRTPDLLTLYLKYQRHHEPETADIEKSDDTELISNDEMTIREALQDALNYIRRLGPDSPESLMIPVYVDSEARCGIYILGKDYFDDQRSTVFGKDRKCQYAGIDIIYTYLYEDNDEVKKHLSLSNDIVFSRYQLYLKKNDKNTIRLYIDQFNAVREEFFSEIRAKNGPWKPECPKKYRKFYDEPLENDNSLQLAIEQDNEAMNDRSD